MNGTTDPQLTTADVGRGLHQILTDGGDLDALKGCLMQLDVGTLHRRHLPHVQRLIQAVVEVDRAASVLSLSLTCGDPQ